jgi:hypothetical protein
MAPLNLTARQNEFLDRLPVCRQFAGQTTRVAMPELSVMSRLRSGQSTLDAWVRPFRRTALQLRLRTQESAATLSPGTVPSTIRTGNNWRARGASPPILTVLERGKEHQMWSVVMVVVLKAFVEHCVSLVLGHPFECSRLDISQTDVFYCSSPPGGSQQHSLARWIVHPIVAAHRENRQQRRTIFISIPRVLFQFLEPSGEKTALRFLPRQT